MWNEKNHWKLQIVNDGDLKGAKLEIAYIKAGADLVGSPGEPAHYELFLGEKLIAKARHESTLAHWAFDKGADRITTMPQADWGKEQEQ